MFSERAMDTWLALEQPVRSSLELRTTARSERSNCVRSDAQTVPGRRIEHADRNAVFALFAVDMHNFHMSLFSRAIGNLPSC